MSRMPTILKMLCRGGVFVGLLVATTHADVAMAYWQTGGTGVGAAQVAQPHSPLRVNQTASLAAVAPGVPAQTLDGDFDNGNAGPVHVRAVKASIAAVVKAPGAEAGSCDAGDFVLSHRTAKVGADVPSGRGAGAWTGPTIVFNNKPGVNQNPCMGATVKLRYTIS